MKTALIDGDVLVYRAAWKAERVFDWGNDLYSVVADLNEARGHYQHMLADVVAGARCFYYTVVMSDPAGKTFRHALYPDYKKSRHKAGHRRPIVFQPLRNELIANEDAIFEDRLEGDDLLGILQDKDTVICTIDKDLKSIPGDHFNFDKRDLGVYHISPVEASQFFLQQSMAGDPTDGIPGIPGIGMKTAKKVLEKEGYCWQTVIDAYKKANLSQDHALTMARLVRILDCSLYDMTAQSLTLWTPTLV